MAAIDTPWMNSMSTAANSNDARSQTTGEALTTAAFTATSTTSSSYFPRPRTTVLVHQKSPLLLATPPQITRALAYSHPFLLVLNKLVGLISWTTGDAWESFLVLAGFWAATLYGDVLIRWAGHLLAVVALVSLMYVRRFSPLSTTGWIKEQAVARKRSDSEMKSRNHKTLDEIVDTLKVFTSRCNILLDPFIRLTDFLSTQSTATSSTVRPALTSLFLRILLLTPIWLILTLPPFYIITTRRFVLILGTFGLSFHSKPARISRTILWRSRTIRRISSVITGLEFSTSSTSQQLNNFRTGQSLPHDANSIRAALAAARKTKRTGKSVGVETLAKESIRFTFTVYENQRRWMGIGWTTSMLAYERAAWTDDQLNRAPSKDRFALPEVEGNFAEWRWCDDSSWSVEGPGDEEDNAPSTTNAKSKQTPGAQSGNAKNKELGKTNKTTTEPGGWIYFDSQWRFPKRQDGWGRYTRRRKWCRDAELIEVDTTADSTIPFPSLTSSTIPYNATPTKEFDRARGIPGSARKNKTHTANGSITSTFQDVNDSSSANAKQRRPWFGRTRTNSKLSTTDEEHEREHEAAVRYEEAGSNSERSGNRSNSFVFSVDSFEEDGYVPMSHRGRQGAVEADWGVGDDVGMALG